MPTTFTPNYNFNEPQVGADSDVWGGLLNANWASIDTILQGIDNQAASAEAKADQNILDIAANVTGIGTNVTDIATLNARNLTAGAALLGGGDLTADRTFDVDVGTGPDQVVQLDAGGILPVIDGTALTGMLRSFVSAALPITLAGQVVFSHGLGAVPILATAQAVCTAPNNGYTVGERLQVPLVNNTSASNSKENSVLLTATDVTIRFTSSGSSAFRSADRTTGDPIGLDNASWVLHVTVLAII